MTSKTVQAFDAGYAQCTEASRIAFLLQRDGAVATLIWVRRTLVIYRSAVMDRKHFAHTRDYRRKFIASILDLRRWLASNGGYAGGGTGRRTANADEGVTDDHAQMAGFAQSLERMTETARPDRVAPTHGGAAL